MPTGGRQTVGQWGERQAAEWLTRHGFRILARNFRTTRGEIDVVGQRATDYYFVEVKTRRAGPLASDLAVTPHKERRFRQAVAAYCYRHGLTDNASQILATLLVTVYPTSRRVRFRLVVWR